MPKFLKVDVVDFNNKMNEILINTEEIKSIKEIVPETILIIEDKEKKGTLKEFNLLENGYKTWIFLRNKNSFNICYSKLSIEELIKVYDFEVFEKWKNFKTYRT